MAELDEAKAAFASDVEALKALGLQVQAESFSVRPTMEQAHAKMAEASRLREEANAALEQFGYGPAEAETDGFFATKKPEVPQEM